MVKNRGLLVFALSVEVQMVAAHDNLFLSHNPDARTRARLDDQERAAHDAHQARAIRYHCDACDAPRHHHTAATTTTTLNSSKRIAAAGGAAKPATTAICDRCLARQSANEVDATLGSAGALRPRRLFSFAATADADADADASPPARPHAPPMELFVPPLRAISTALSADGDCAMLVDVCPRRPTPPPIDVECCSLDAIQPATAAHASPLRSSDGGEQYGSPELRDIASFATFAPPNVDVDRAVGNSTPQPPECIEAPSPMPPSLHVRESRHSTEEAPPIPSERVDTLADELKETVRIGVKRGRL